MTQEEKEIGAKWLGILAMYNNDFATKALFGQTAAYLKSRNNIASTGQKSSKFKREIKIDSSTGEKENKFVKQKPLTLQEAAKMREKQQQQEQEEPEYDDDIEMQNILATSETDDFTGKKSKKK